MIFSIIVSLYLSVYFFDSVFFCLAFENSQCTLCDRNIFYILNCHLCGTSELRIVPMVCPYIQFIYLLFSFFFPNKDQL